MSEFEQTSRVDLHRLLWARSVAVVGASSNPAKLGHIILRNILQGGFLGQVYPINPTATSVLGLPAFPNLDSVPDEIDLVIFCVPGTLIPDLLEQAKRKNSIGGIVISGGFREIGNLDLEKNLIDKAKKLGIRLIGPNCQGIIFTPNHLCASWPLIDRRGPIAVISQSGTIAATLAGWAADDEIGISGVISLGNQVDLCETDFMQMFAQDPETLVIAMYIEGVKNGRRFFEQAKKIDKPILILKSGRTSSGERAAASHTKSLAGSDEVFSGVCQQAGIFRTQSIEDLYDLAKGFASLPLPKGNRLMVLTSSGGSGILAVDVADENGLCIPPLSSGIIQDLKNAQLPSAMVIGNPLDLTGDATADDYQKVLAIAETHQQTDLYLFIFGDPIPRAAELLGETLSHLKKPAVVCYLGGGQVQEDEVKQFHAWKVPVFSTPERATRALAAVYANSCNLQI